MKHLLVLSLLFVLAPTSFAATQNPVVWDAALPWPEGSFEHDRFLSFAKKVKEATAGRVVINGLAAEQHKWPVDKLFQASRAGLTPVSEWILSQASFAEPIAGIGSVLEPASDWNEAYQRYAERRALLEDALSRQGLVLMYMSPWGPPGLFTREAPTSLSAASGYKVKVYDSFGKTFIEELGGKALDIPFKELDNAFKEDKVNAVLTSPANGLAAKIYNRTMYFTELRAAFPLNAVVVGRAHLQSLPDADRNLLLKTAKEAEADVWKQTAARYQASKERLAARGMVILQSPAWLVNATNQVTKMIMSGWLATLPKEQSAALRNRRAH